VTVEEDGADFRGEPRLGGEGALVRGQREGVLLLAGDRAITVRPIFKPIRGSKSAGRKSVSAASFFTAVLDLASAAKWRVALS
jgi:hypothetical protein